MLTIFRLNKSTLSYIAFSVWYVLLSVITSLCFLDWEFGEDSPFSNLLLAILGLSVSSLALSFSSDRLMFTVRKGTYYLLRQLFFTVGFFVLLPSVLAYYLSFNYSILVSIVIAGCVTVIINYYLNKYFIFNKIKKKFELKFSALAWAIHPIIVDFICIFNGKKIRRKKSYIENKFYVGEVEKSLLSQIVEMYSDLKKIPFCMDDHDPNYVRHQMGVQTEADLNAFNDYNMLDDQHFDVLRPILNSIKDQVSECLGSPWRILTIRSWDTPPSADGSNNPTAKWHRDGLGNGIRKIMLYLTDVDNYYGATTLETKSGTFKLDGPAGTFLLFDSNDVRHKACLPREGVRRIIEITICKSITYELTGFSAGLNGQYPLFPWLRPSWHGQKYCNSINLKGVNIGGGPKWSSSNWLNLEEVKSKICPNGFYLYPNCKFPLKKECVSLVYSSHTFEHLNKPTIYRILSESDRILREKGFLIIKVPNFEKALDAWRSNDNKFFENGWGFKWVTPFWENKGVSDDISSRASMIFCSVHNEEFGNPFEGRRIQFSENAYFGPPLISTEKMQNILAKKSPLEISETLRHASLEKNTNYTLVHQISWSREEMKEYLADFGFEVITFDKATILKKFQHEISGIEEMSELSMYCMAKKT